MKKYPSTDRMKQFLDEFTPPTLRQQYLLYGASNDVFFDGVPDSERSRRPKGITIPEANELVRKVQRSDYARAHWPKFATGPITLVDNDTSKLDGDIMVFLSGKTKYGGAFTDDEPIQKHFGGGLIHLADNGFAMQPQVVLHELGHVIEAFERPVPAREGHNAAFARTNIELIHEFMSPEKAKELEDAFAYAGVQVAPVSQSQPHRSLR